MPMVSIRSWSAVAAVVMLSSSFAWGWGGGITPQSVPREAAPGQVPVTAAAKPTATGTGRYEVSGMNFHLQNVGSFTDFRESSQPLKGDSARDSVIVIRGTIHGNGVQGANGKGQAASFHPVFNGEAFFPGLPQGCRSEVVTYPQLNLKGQNYVTYVSLKETAGKPECWEYFRTLKTLPLELKEIKAGTRANLPPLPVLDGDRRNPELGPLLPKKGKK